MCLVDGAGSHTPVADGGWTSGSERQLARVLVGFARTLGTDFSVQKTLDRLVQQMVEIVPITGAGVMVMGERDQLHFVATSNDRVTRIEELQNELHEGPCLEAYRTGRLVAVDDLARDTRFPRFSPRAAADGLAAVFTFPMRLDAERLGAVDLYRDTPGPLSQLDLHAAQVLADIAAAYLVNAHARTDAYATVARLNHRSLHDPLTGLPNRTLFGELLDSAVARARRSKHTAAVLFVDLDGFKSVNDRHGHHVGDLLLRAVADTLSLILRPGDTLARFGGDEFVVLCEDLRDTADALALAERITVALSSPFDLAGARVVVSASVGIAFSGPGQDIPQLLLRSADFAMYQAKTNGGGHYEVLDPKARIAVDRRHDLERDLQRAEERGQLSLVYQPIVDVGSRALTGFEALVRWQHPQRGLLGPAIIIPSAERTGLILPLGEWVLRQACLDLQRWQTSAPPLRTMAVNVSAQQLMGAAFVEMVERVLHETGVDPGSLWLEITETVFLADGPRALLVMNDLKALGVKLALDDFGTAYSSLGCLRDFPFDAVKIDRSFTAQLSTDQATRFIVQAMVDLSHALGLAVVAEGVETAPELAQVSDLGADRAQGFLFSHPVTADELTGMVAEGGTWELVAVDSDFNPLEGLEPVAVVPAEDATA